MFLEVDMVKITELDSLAKASLIHVLISNPDLCECFKIKLELCEIRFD